MSVALLTLMFTLQAAPTTGVALTKRSGVNRNLANTRAELVRSQLGEGVSPIEDLTRCNGKKPCLVKAAREKGWSAMVTIETATVLDEGIIDVALLSIDDDGKELSRVTEQGPEGKLGEAITKKLSALVTELKKLTAPPTSTPTADPGLKTPPPQETVVVVAEPPPVVLPPPPPPPAVVTSSGERPAARWVPLGISVVILGAGVTSFILSKNAAAQLRSGTLTTEGQIAQTVNTGSTLQALGLAGMIAGGALSAGSLVLALLWPETKLTPSVALAPGLSLFGVTGVWP